MTYLPWSALLRFGHQPHFCKYPTKYVAGFKRDQTWPTMGHNLWPIWDEYNFYFFFSFLILYRSSRTRPYRHPQFCQSSPTQTFQMSLALTYLMLSVPIIILLRCKKFKISFSSHLVGTDSIKANPVFQLFYQCYSSILLIFMKKSLTIKKCFNF